MNEKHCPVCRMKKLYYSSRRAARDVCMVYAWFAQFISAMTGLGWGFLVSVFASLEGICSDSVAEMHFKSQGLTSVPKRSE